MGFSSIFIAAAMSRTAPFRLVAFPAIYGPAAMVAMRIDAARCRSRASVVTGAQAPSQHLLDGAHELAVDADQRNVLGQRHRLALQPRYRASLQDHASVRGEIDRLRGTVV